MKDVQQLENKRTYAPRQKRTPAEQKAWRKQQQHEWYLKNKERVIEHQRAYRQKLQQKYDKRLKKSKEKKETSES